MAKPNLKDVAKQLDSASKAIAKDRQDIANEKSKVKGENIRLQALNDALNVKNDKLQALLDKKTKEIEMLDKSGVELLEVNTRLDKSKARAKQELDELMRQIGEVGQELIDKKANLDKELEEYALVRKQEIKTEILKANEELIVLSDRVAQLVIDIETKKLELASLNQTYIDEQTELKQSEEQTKRLLDENLERQVAIKSEVTEAERELQELSYKKDQMTAMLTKSREEHDKFLAYEKKARAILDVKDRQLQDKSAELSQGSQFLKNQRSFLPPM